MEKTITNRLYIADKTPEQVMDFLLRPQNWQKFSTGIIDVKYPGESLSLNTTGAFFRKQGPNILTEEFRVTELDYGKKLTLEVTTNLFYAHDTSTYEAEGEGTRATFHETLKARGLLGKVFLGLLGGVISKSLQEDYARLKTIVEST